MKNTLILDICIIMENGVPPKILYVDSIFNSRIGVKPVPEQYNSPICIPQENVFKYDEKLFEELNEAYKIGDQKLLKELCSKAKRWEPQENSK
jgi:hypothetical protein